MLWEIEIQPVGHDAECQRVEHEWHLLTAGKNGMVHLSHAARGFLIEGELSRQQIEQLVEQLLVDPLVERGKVGRLNEVAADGCLVTVLLKPGVMDPVALSVIESARDFDLTVESVRTFRRYYGGSELAPVQREMLYRKLLCNDAIEQAVEGPLALEHLAIGTPYIFRPVTVPLQGLDDTALIQLSRSGQLSLSLEEMRTIQKHFQEQGRDPYDVELETLAQTWSEHCSHKTLKGEIDFDGQQIRNLLKETIFAATQQLRQRWGAEDWCVSVFEDNAGVVKFDDQVHICFKVETHNHPSAIEPYGGANTGLGGVIRDPLGTGLGARPICNTDVFCFAPPDTLPETLPVGVLHPRRVMQGVVAGVRDYGNRMGIPTVNGAVCFDERYLGNPLVYCGTVGTIRVDRAHKDAHTGDLIVAVGGRTGRDGIHGATFSSIELTSESEKISGGAVQIGNAITEKKLLDVLLQARDENLYSAITDCGAGGFSSAIGEMGAELGAVVHLERAPLKYEGLSYTEIWISESQERMILAVPPARWPALHALCFHEGVEATILGHFEKTGRLRLQYRGHPVGDLDMHFLHEGRPQVVRKATWQPPALPASVKTQPSGAVDCNATLRQILGSWNVCSKEWIIRQYDHEVQGRSVLKPLVGVANDGPGDAAVVLPVLGSTRGVAIGCGINPRLGDLDPYAMAAAAIDEAVRNVVAVGADPRRIALLDNFCWGNTDRPEVLGSLVRAAQACHDLALAYEMPFISGKDSLKNEFHAGDRHIVIPPTLLISALGQIPDVHRCVSMDLKEAGNVLYLVGSTREEMGGSHFNLVHRLEGGVVPQVDQTQAPLIFQALHRAMKQGLVRSCHDLSEGGLAVAVAEMAFAGGLGADLTSLGGSTTPLRDEVLLFAESCTRFVVEVKPDHTSALESLLGSDIPLSRLGQVCKEPRLRAVGASGEWILWAPLNELKEAWQKPLRW